MIRRRWRAAGFLLILVLAVVVALADRLVWRPYEDPVARTDAVVVLGGSYAGARVALGRELAAQEGIPLALSVSRVTSAQCRPTRSSPRPPICFRPDPFTTQGEARWISASAAARGWRSVTVVVTTDQVARARLRMRRCHIPGLRIAAVSTSRWFRLKQVPYQLAAFVKAETLQRSC